MGRRPARDRDGVARGEPGEAAAAEARARPDRRQVGEPVERRRLRDRRRPPSTRISASAIRGSPSVRCRSAASSPARSGSAPNDSASTAAMSSTSPSIASDARQMPATVTPAASSSAASGGHEAGSVRTITWPPPTSRNPRATRRAARSAGALCAGDGQMWGCRASRANIVTASSRRRSNASWLVGQRTLTMRFQNGSGSRGSCRTSASPRSRTTRLGIACAIVSCHSRRRVVASSRLTVRITIPR